jgi:dihydrofolate reductase
MERKVILYIASSVDGYIAAPGDDLSFLSLVEQPDEDYGYTAFTETVDTVIMGRRTYDWVMTQVDRFPHADKESYIITRSVRPAEGNVQFYTGPLHELIQRLKLKKGKNIFVDGGAEVVNSLLQHQLIDEIVLSLIPILLGEGTRLFREGFSQQNLALKEVKQFDTGLVQLHYTRKRP